MDIDNYVTALQQKGVELWIDENDRIAFRDPDNTLTESEKEGFQTHEHHIVQRLKKGDVLSIAYPLSVGQEALWFIYKTAPESTAYNTCPESCRIRFDIDPATIEASFQALVNRHACLRTLFYIQKNGSTVQHVYAHKRADLEQIDAAGENEGQLQRRVEDAYNRPFDLENEIPIRMVLVSRSKQDHVLLLTVHHIVTDLTSDLTLWQEFQEIYEAKTSGRDIRLPHLTRSFQEFVDLENDWKNSPRGRTDLAYWENTLSGGLAPLELPFDYPRPPVQTFKGDTRHFEIDTRLSQEIKSLSKACKTSLLRVFLAAFTILLHRSAARGYSARDEFVVGVPASVRPLPEFKGIAGYFINLLPIQTDLSGDPDFTTLLERINQTMRGAISHMKYPFPAILKALKIDRDLSHTPVFQSTFTLYDKPLNTLSNENGGLNRQGPVEAFPIEQQEGQFDLAVSLYKTEDAFSGSFKYNRALFKPETIHQMIGHFNTLLKGLVDNPGRPVSHISMLTDEERRKILIEFNNTEAGYPDDKCLHELFESQAEKTPDAVAVMFEDDHLTYRELNRRSNQLGHYLRNRGVQPGSLVGICMERSFDMIIGLLGVLKAGGAYVPLDPEYPEERLAFMMTDAQTPVLLSQKAIAANLPDTAAHIICTDEAWHSIALESVQNPVNITGPRDPIYAIYTSGSTGKPKAAVNTHQALCNRLSWMQKAYQLSPEDRILQKTPFSFDVSGWEFFWPLLTGAGFVFAKPGGHKDSAYLVELIRERQITVLHFVPSMLQVFLNEQGVELCTGIKKVICSGEALPFTLQEMFFDRLDAELHNLYGPTEAAIDVTYWPCQKDSSLTFVPIGYPIDNTRLYILDQSLKPVPVGVAGELHIGGPGLARGYLNRPELTKKTFIENPFSGAPGDRLYKTGDLCRWMHDGAVEFLGRIDHQVKIRGFRIELGEIESVLGAHDRVREVVVTSREYQTGDKKLIAYVTLKDREKAPPRINEPTEDLKSFLRARLPNYMIPALFVFMDTLPLSSNGKIDRKALPEPDLAALGSISEFVPPGNLTEKLLADVFSDVLLIDGIGSREIGIHDSFFDLGGDSIQGIKVVSRAREAGLDFSIEQLFQKQTIHELARLAGSSVARSSDGHSPKSGVAPFSLLSEKDRLLRDRDDLDDAYPLSALQTGMYFHTEYHKHTAVYHDVFSYHIQGRPDHGILEKAVQGMVTRHPALRTSFVTTGFDELLQFVHKKVSVAVASHDLTLLSPEKQAAVVDEWIEKEKSCHFDWSKAPLVRFVMHLRSRDSFNLGISFHHAILDGWSVASMVAELIQAYQSLLNGSPVPADPVLWGFRDFVALERAAVDSEKHRQYWLRKLQDFDFLQLPRWPVRFGRERLDAIESEIVPVPPSLLTDLKHLSKDAKVPIKSVLLAAHMNVLRLLAGTTDITAGLVTNGRPEQLGAESALGLFLNTVPFRLDLPGGTWHDLMRDAFDAEIALTPFRRYPLSEIQNGGGGAPVFEVIFGYNHFHVYKKSGDIRILNTRVFERTNFPLVVNFDMNAVTSEMTLRLVYNNTAFCRKQIQWFAGYHISSLKAMAKDPSGRYESHSVLSGPERNMMLAQFNDTEKTCPKDKCIHQLFEDQVERQPDATALMFGSRQLTYQTLNRRANRLAHYLRRLGVGPESLVGICMERSVDMIVGILGILKAGGAYVPVDPGYPADRIAFMLNDTQASVVLTHPRFIPLLPEGNATLVCPDRDRDVIARESSANVASHVTPANLAYVIYTSGSTGTPKGSAIPHDAIPPLVTHTDYIRITPRDRISHASNVSFDAATFEIWAPLANGAAIVGIDRETALSPSKLAACIREMRISIMFLTTALFNQISELNPHVFRPLTYLLFGGEAVNPQRVKHILETAPPKNILHLYGPTETTTFATWHRISHVPEDARTIPIGTPLANMQCYILDPYGLPVPVGASGELHIAGAGLARGYLNRPSLTEETFVPNPYEPGSRLYKTGDLCRYLPDGAIEFLGRLDQQIKIRGFRIELGEIECELSRHEQIKEAIVIAHEPPSGEKLLAAYLVPQSSDRPMAPDHARKYLETRLPGYMIPAVFIVLDALPLTPNGKIDRKALPAPDFGIMREHEIITPKNETEEIISGIWKEMLNLDKISVHDNFFRMGGHSLLAVAVVSRMEEIFGKKISIRKLFELPTITALSREMERTSSEGNHTAYRPILPKDRNGTCGLSLTQQRLWYLSELDNGKNCTYNIPMSCSVTGNLDIGAVKQALNEIVSRHDVLRTVITDAAEPVQVAFPESRLDPPVVDLSAEKDSSEAVLRIASSEALTPFDLTRGPFIRAKILCLGDENHILLITIHHIIFDGWSSGIFFQEFQALYRAYVEDKPPQLPDLEIQYPDFAQWQTIEFSGDRLKNHLDYWKNYLAGAPLLFEPPVDLPRPPVQTFNGDSVRFELDADLAGQVKDLSQKSGATLFMTLHAAFAVLLLKYSGKEDIVIGTLIANRNHKQIEPLIGFFGNLLPLRADLSGDPAFTTLLNRVKDSVLGAYEHQELPFKMLLDGLGIKRSRQDSHPPLFQVVFDSPNIGPFGESFDIAGARFTISDLVGLPTGTKYDLDVSVEERGGKIRGVFVYNTDLFYRDTINTMKDRFVALLAAIVSKPEQTLSRL